MMVRKEQKKILLRIPKENLEKLQQEAVSNNVSVTAQINFILSNFLKKVKINKDGK